MFTNRDEAKADGAMRWAIVILLCALCLAQLTGNKDIAVTGNPISQLRSFEAGFTSGNPPSCCRRISQSLVWRANRQST